MDRAWLKRNSPVILGLFTSLVQLFDAGNFTAVTVVPLVVGVLLRIFLTPQPQEDSLMADLTALQQAATDLQAAVAAVDARVAQLRADAVPQAVIDPITSQVQAATAQLQADAA